MKNPVVNSHQRPVGYLRAKIHCKSFLVKVMIDSGNLCGDLMSEELAKALKLKITGQPRSVGTASSKGSVTILGRVAPFRLYLEGIQEAVTVEPFVVKDLAHPLNLGQSFLRRHEVDMTFRGSGIQIRLRNSSTMLDSDDVPLTKSSIDSRIRSVLDKLKEQGDNPFFGKEKLLDLRVHGVNYGPNKKPIVFGETRTRLYNPEKTLLKAGCTTVVEMERGNSGQPAQPLSNKQNSVQFIPKVDNKLLNKKMILVHPGTYTRNGNTVKVLVTNFSKQDVSLPKFSSVGTILEAIHELPTSVNLLDHRPVETLTEAELRERRSFIIDTLKLDDNNLLWGKPEAKEQIIDIFLQNWDAISISDSDYGKTNLMKFHIEIPSGTKPVRAKQRPLNPFQEQDLRRQLDDWLDAGVIEPSMSPWSSALVPCRKKNSDKLRWAVDYRAVNNLTKKDAYPLAQIEANLNKLSDTGIFSCLDSAGAFHTLTVEEEHRDYTAFNTPMGQYRFCRLPFGLTNAPAAFSRLVQMALDRLPPGFALGYIDDIIIYSKSVPEHIDHLRQVVELHVQCGMKLNLQKCHIVQREVEYLGHLVSKNGVRMIPSYVQRILEWPLPQTGKELRSFLGFCGYYRCFIKEFADLTYEMNKMKSGNRLEWTDATREKFEKLKTCFKQEPVRGYPRYDLPDKFILDTDYSATNMAAVLSQKQYGKEVFLGCVARKCNKAESNYASHKGEMGAVIMGLKKFEHILRARPFIIRSDSQAVKYMQTIKEVRGIWARWSVFLSSFQFTLEHRSGSKQVNADAISRMPGLIPDPDAEAVEPNEPLHDVEDIYLVTSLKPMENEDLAKATAEDPVTNSILQFVKTKHKPDKQERKTLTATGMSYVNVFECLETQDGVLYYKPPVINGVKTSRRICLPITLYALAFELSHADPSGASGHYGMNSTYRKMRNRFYFPNMYHYIAARVNNCVPCITKKSTVPKAEHQQHREQLSYFGQRVYIDVVGPLTAASYQGKACKFLLTIQDGFTRYLVAVPIPDQVTSTIVTALMERWIYVHGVCETLHSDNGSSFTSHLFKEVMHRLGITKTYTPVYSPQGDRVERAHRVLGDIIRADRRYDANRWPQKISAAVLAYNATVNRLTGMSPFEAVYGRPVNLPVDVVFPFPDKTAQSWAAHVEEFKLKFSRICEVMCKTQRTGLMRDNARFQARQGPRFSVGDHCYYFLARVRRGLSKKLTSRWLGPFEVKKVISEALVVIYPLGNWCETPKEISAIVNRLVKVDPQHYPSARLGAKVDLEVIADDLDEYSEYLSYQDDFADERDYPSTPPSMPLPNLDHLGDNSLNTRQPETSPEVSAETAEDREVLPKVEEPSESDPPLDETDRTSNHESSAIELEPEEPVPSPLPRSTTSDTPMRIRPPREAYLTARYQIAEHAAGYQKKKK